MKTALPFFSVVVCSYNGASTIGRTLTSLKNLDYPKDRYEIIVVNDGSTDDTASQAASFNVQVVTHRKNKGLAAARNTGLNSASGDIYVGFDDDTTADSKLLTELARAYEAHPHTAGVSSILKEPAELKGLADHYMAANSAGHTPSLQLNPEQNIVKRFVAYLRHQVAPVATPKQPYQVSRIYGATATFPVDVLKTVHGWDESMSGVEDTDLCTRIAKQFPDRPFYAAPKAFIVHDPKMSVTSLFRRGLHRGPINLKYYRRFGLTPPIFPYPIAWLVITGTLTVFSPLAGLLSLILLPQLLYFWWTPRSMRERNPRLLAMPYLQLGEELAQVLGLLRGYAQIYSPKNTLAQLVNQFNTDSLFRNAVYLMSSTAIMSVLGFGFWFFIAHFYTPAAIGAASALIGISLLIQYFSYLGLDTGLVRFLPKSKNQSADINASLIVIALTAVVASGVYTFFNLGSNLPFFASSILGHNILIVLMTLAVLNSVTDNVFIANRKAEYHTATYAVLGLTKLILPLFLISLGSLGIFLAYAVSAIVSLILTYFLMRRAAHYRFLTRPNWRFISSTRKFVGTIYFSKLISALPAQLMPVLIIAKLGAPSAAFYSMAWTMANLLYVVPSATSNSMLAESSTDIQSHRRHVAHSIRLLAVILTPAIALAILVAPFLLKIFGPQYAQNGTLIFQILAATTFFVAINYLGMAILSVAKRATATAVVQAVIAVATLVTVFPLMQFGLGGVGMAILIGQALGSLVLALLLKRKDKPTATGSEKVLLPSGSELRQFLTMYGLIGAKVSGDLGGGDRSMTVIVTRGHLKRVLKIYNADKHSYEQSLDQVNFMNSLKTSGVPVPRVLSNTNGELVSRTTNKKGQWIGVLMSYESGSHPSEYNDVLIRDLAVLQAKIHKNGTSFTPQAHELPHLSKSTLISFLPRGYSHFDLDEQNILVRGNKVASVIDFEGMRADVLAVCLYFTLTWMYRASGEKTVDAYLEQYQSVRKLRFSERQVIRLALALKFKSAKLLAVG
jgi:O-antigen/teichoic acid export membrane protein/glycosyltransferase involved in cell wall biosynthesis/Ser/Thr protein kinase RdoA (MazF antagonist)